MDGLFPLDVLFRWIHVLTAITVLGGSIFLRFVLMPAAEKLPDDAHEALRGHLMKTWKIFIHAGVVLFLVSGLYNYIFVTIPMHKGDRFYHMLLGIKMLLALGVFFLASVLVGRAAAFESIRQKRKMWLAVIIGLAIAIVLISGYVKVRPIPAPDNSANKQKSAAKND